jgi:16S rRNA (cytosine1402-N4)-methyltransferase
MVDRGHVPVLLQELLALLDPRPGDTVVDATAGRGGHALALAERIGPAGTIVLLDLDADNLEFAARALRESARCSVHPIHDSFVRVPEHLARLGAAADVLLADLGFSSSQIDDPSRGLSFAKDGPLDMRLNRSAPITAADLIASFSERELSDLIRRWGEDPYAAKIARKLAQSRAAEPIQTTAQLARIVLEAYGPRARQSRIHPATRTFMALRIAVNDELGALSSLLDLVNRSAGKHTPQAGWLKLGARIGIISFHSLEDRLVKRAFGDLVHQGRATALTKRPITASEAEIDANPRSRSAKLRAVRLAAGGPG